MPKITLTTIADAANRQLVEEWLDDGPHEAEARCCLAGAGRRAERNSTSAALAHALVTQATDDDARIGRINKALQLLGSENGPRRLASLAPCRAE